MNFGLGLLSAWGPKSWTVYVLGLVIIVLYAKDKFNVPTYDKDAMGSFAQLPPQFLTVDSRYRRGKLIYLGLMICLYTALCIVGPTTFSSLGLSSVASQLGPVGPSMENSEIWPVVSATFLISTAAAKDTSILGRIELFIRQYAHRAAYIPSAVSELAFSLRNFDIKQWLISSPYLDKNEFQERKEAIAELAGQQAFDKITEHPEQEGELTGWIRANVLFYALQQLFTKRQALSSTKLDYLIDLAENRDHFERIQADRNALAAKVVAEGESAAALEQIYPEVQRLIKTTSIMLAVLLSQAARNSNYLSGHLNQLGFQGLDLRDRSDHFVYVSFVNIFILLGAMMSLLVVVALVVFPPNLSSEHYFPAAISVATGALAYIVLFRILDYSRDSQLESLDWRERLDSYLKTVITCGIITALVCMILTILVFSISDVLKEYLSPLTIAQMLVFQIIVAGLGAAFGILYARRAARLPFSKLAFWNPAVIKLPLIHAVCATILVGGLNYFINYQNIENAPQMISGGIRAQVAYYRANLDKLSGGTSWFSGKEVKHVSQLLGLIDDGLVRSNYWETQRGLTSGARRARQKDAIATSCAELQRFVVEFGQDLFSDPARCRLAEYVEPKDDGDRRFMALVGSLTSLIDALDPVETSSVSTHMPWLFPAVTAFILALMYGIGFIYGRGWWLYNECSREDGQIAKLKEQAEKAVGASIDFDRWLITPLPSLSFLTPIEAVRYEDFRGKLFSSVQRRKIDMSRFVIKPADEPHPEEMPRRKMDAAA